MYKAALVGIVSVYCVFMVVLLVLTCNRGEEKACVYVVCFIDMAVVQDQVSLLSDLPRADEIFSAFPRGFLRIVLRCYHLMAQAIDIQKLLRIARAELDILRFLFGLTW